MPNPVFASRSKGRKEQAINPIMLYAIWIFVDYAYCNVQYAYCTKFYAVCF
jgi:hypothetical protein